MSNGGIWITTPRRSVGRNRPAIVIEKFGPRVSFNHSATRLYAIKPEERVHIYVEKNRISIFVVNSYTNGLRLCKIKKRNSTAYRYRIYVKQIHDACKKLGIKLPLSVPVTFDKAQRCWIGSWGSDISNNEEVKQDGLHDSGVSAQENTL